MMNTSPMWTPCMRSGAKFPIIGMMRSPIFVRTIPMTATLTKNNAGAFVSIVKVAPNAAPSFDGQQYAPLQYLWDDELKEWVSFYWLDRHLRSDDGGAQCIWIDNDAEVENPNEFGIKLTSMRVGPDSNAKSCAYAMYQRNKAAAENGLAPPVHGMCCFKAYDKSSKELHTYWGYLVSRADTFAIQDSVTDPDQCDEYDDYICEQQEKHDKASDVKTILEDLGIYTGRIMDDIYDEIGPHPDDINFFDWCEENGVDYIDSSDLNRSLRGISLVGMQSDWAPVGTPMVRGRMGGDLHQRNLALWNGEIVCIDFGYHCVE